MREHNMLEITPDVRSNRNELVFLNTYELPSRPYKNSCMNTYTLTYTQAYISIFMKIYIYTLIYTHAHIY